MRDSLNPSNAIFHRISLAYTSVLGEKIQDVRSATNPQAVLKRNREIISQLRDILNAMKNMNPETRARQEHYLKLLQSM